MARAGDDNQRVAVDVRRGPERFHTVLPWLDSWHSFSFGEHRDPANVGHGLLIVNNDDTIRGGGGFGEHGHRDMEIVTWVLEGALEHRDSTGTVGVIVPGLAQRMSAGRGIRHSEVNASATEPLHLVQMWVLPDTPGVEPSYEQREVSDALISGTLVPVASGRGDDGTVRLHQRDAVLWAGRLDAGATVRVPDAPHVHLFVARGAVDLDGTGSLRGGDAARLTDAGALGLRAETDAEVLVWETA
ncbi:MAG TPA: pirin family protein [Acidimicrobiia bacterium]|nr:pirin family protein [Acidimicrobiia bacterium]